MTHDTVRATITDGRTSPEVAIHLEDCATCRSFAAAHSHILELAPSLAAQPTDGLADRVLEHLGATPSATATSTSSPTVLPLRRRPWDGTLRRVTAVAAAITLVAGAVGVALQARDDDPRAVVLASAERTAAEGSAEVEVEADAEVVVDVPGTAPGTMPSDPDFSRVPVEMQAHIQATWEATMLEFQRQLEQFQADVDAALQEYERLLAEWQRQIEEAFRELGEGFGGSPSEDGDEPFLQMPTMPDAPLPPGVPGAPPEPSTAPPPPPPTSVSARVDVRARGVIAFGDGLRLAGTAAPSGQVAVDDDASFGLHVAGDTAVYLGPDGTWTQLPGAAGPLGQVILDPSAVSHVLAAVGDDVVLSGDAEIDGTSVRRFQFTVREDVLADAGVTAGSGDRWNAEAWIDAEGRTRRLMVSSDAVVDQSGTTWRTRVDLRLSNFGRGAPDEPLPDPATRMELPAPSSLLIYPFGANVAATTHLSGGTNG